MTDAKDSMTFEQAASYILPFGKKYYGWSLRGILDQDPGFIDWLWRKAEIRSRRLRLAIDTFCACGDVKDRIFAHRAEKRRRQYMRYNRPEDHL